MQIDLYDSEKFIEVNKLEEVTDPILFIRGATPSPHGLLSTDIFGVSSLDRKRTYAYISLHDYFINPYIYKILKRINRNFEHIVHCSRNFIIKNGELIEDEENGETGLSFLYKNWEKINFEKNNSLMRNERIDVLKSYKKNVIFTKYLIVIPAFYRDVNFQEKSKGKLSHHPLNDKYSKIIRLASLIKNSNNFDFVMNSTKAKIQDTLIEIYDLLKSKIEKKQGLIRKSILGKSIDYGSRLVISAPTFHAERFEDMQIDFYHTGIPLSHCCSLFTPFIVSWVKNFFRREFEAINNKYPVKQKDGTIQYVELDNPELFFDDELIKKEINRFIKAPTDRFSPIELPVKNKKDNKPIYFSFAGRVYSKSNPMSESTIINRPATWCDILYQAAVDVTRDKMVYITRYPLLDYFGIFPSGITVLSTIKTIPVMIGETVYNNYPLIEPDKSKEAVAVSFLDTVTMSNLYLKGLDGDYDGDQITVKGLFTQEANEEARRIMMSKSHILNASGNNMRTTEKEGIQTLYMLTKF